MAFTGDSVWLITGCSSGFGQALAAEAAGRGFRVVATARDPAALAGLAARFGERVMTAALDVTDPVAVRGLVAAALARFGALDVLVNNAGHGYIAALEEGEDAAIRALFEVNVFALADVTRAVLPAMRARGLGHVVNMGSIAGMAPNPGVAYYAASKAALEGLSDALALEVAGFGIGVTLVEPGPFRTEFAGRSLGFAPALAAYAGTPAGERRAAALDGGALKGGDPARAAALIVDAVTAPVPPRRLVLGGNAVARARAKLAATAAEIEAWVERSIPVDRAD